MLIRRTHDPQKFFVGDSWQVDLMVFKNDGVTPLPLANVGIEWKIAKIDTGEVIKSVSIDRDMGLGGLVDGTGVSVTGDGTAGACAIKLDFTQTSDVDPGSYQDQIRVNISGDPAVILTGRIDVATPI